MLAGSLVDPGGSGRVRTRTTKSIGRLRRFYTSRMERKLATVLFVDLVDSTSMVTGADPEVVRRRVTEFFE
jgi:class 3 adenylate cyclase